MNFDFSLDSAFILNTMIQALFLFTMSTNRMMTSELKLPKFLISYGVYARLTLFINKSIGENYKNFVFITRLKVKTFNGRENLYNNFEISNAVLIEKILRICLFESTELRSMELRNLLFNQQNKIIPLTKFDKKVKQNFERVYDPYFVEMCTAKLSKVRDKITNEIKTKILVNCWRMGKTNLKQRTQIEKIIKRKHAIDEVRNLVRQQTMIKEELEKQGSFDESEELIMNFPGNVANSGTSKFNKSEGASKNYSKAVKKMKLFSGIGKKKKKVEKVKTGENIVVTEYEKMPGVSSGYVIPRILLEEEKPRFLQLFILSQQKLKYNLILSSGFDIDSIREMKNVHFFQKFLRTRIEGIGLSDVKIHIYVSQPLQSTSHPIYHEEINYHNREIFENIIASRLTELVKLSSGFMLKSTSETGTKKFKSKIEIIEEELEEEKIKVEYQKRVSRKFKTKTNLPSSKRKRKKLITRSKSLTKKEVIRIRKEQEIALRGSNEKQTNDVFKKILGLQKSINFVKRLKRSIHRNKNKNLFKSKKRISLFKGNELIFFKFDISPIKQKFKSYRIVLNTKDVIEIFDLREFLSETLGEEVSNKAYKKMLRCNPHIHMNHFLYYLMKKLYLSKSSIYKKIRVMNLPKYFPSNEKQSFSNRFMPIFFKANNNLGPFLNLRDPKTSTICHRVVKKDGKFVIQTFVKQKNDNRIMIKNYIQKNCRLYTTSISKKKLRKEMRNYLTSLLSFFYRIKIDNLPKNLEILGKKLIEEYSHVLKLKESIFETPNSSKRKSGLSRGIYKDQSLVMNQGSSMQLQSTLSEKKFNFLNVDSTHSLHKKIIQKEESRKKIEKKDEDITSPKEMMKIVSRQSFSMKDIERGTGSNLILRPQNPLSKLKPLNVSNLEEIPEIGEGLKPKQIEVNFENDWNQIFDDFYRKHGFILTSSLLDILKLFDDSFALRGFIREINFVRVFITSKNKKSPKNFNSSVRIAHRVAKTVKDYIKKNLYWIEIIFWSYLFKCEIVEKDQTIFLKGNRFKKKLFHCILNLELQTSITRVARIEIYFHKKSILELIKKRISKQELDEDEKANKSLKIPKMLTHVVSSKKFLGRILEQSLVFKPFIPLRYSETSKYLIEILFFTDRKNPETGALSRQITQRVMNLREALNLKNSESESGVVSNIKSSKIHLNHVRDIAFGLCTKVRNSNFFNVTVKKDEDFQGLLHLDGDSAESVQSV